MRAYHTLTGILFRSEERAKEYYGDRFEGALEHGILHRVVVDEEGTIIDTWEPGPTGGTWEIDEKVSEDFLFIYSDNSKLLAELGFSSGRPVNDLEREENKANGLVMAAAKDLLKVVERLVANEKSYAGAANLITEAKAAIQKAKGLK